MKRKPMLWDGARFYDDDQSNYKKRGREMKRLREACGETQLDVVRFVSKTFKVLPITQQAISLWEKSEKMRVPEYIFEAYKRHANDKIEAERFTKKQAPMVDDDFLLAIEIEDEGDEW